MRLRIYHHKIIVISILCVLCFFAWLIVRAMPATEDDIRRSSCFVKGQSYLCLVANKDTVVLHSDSINQQGVWINRHWWWPSCDGRVLTISFNRDTTSIPEAIRHLKLNDADTVRKYIAIGADSLYRLLGRKEIERKELEYYLRSHGVIDEGYTQIANYAQGQLKETKSLRIRAEKLRKMLKADSLSKGKVAFRLVRKNIYKVSWYDNGDSLETVSCDPLITSVSDNGKPMIVHTHRSIKPWGVYAVRNVPWGAARHRKIITVTLGGAPILTTGRYDRGKGHDLPSLFAVNGSPVFTQHGRFIGIIYGKEVVE